MQYGLSAFGVVGTALLMRNLVPDPRARVALMVVGVGLVWWLSRRLPALRRRPWHPDPDPGAEADPEAGQR